ncbi:DMT family transporter [Lactiplantibacillus plantarum]|uniref:DMT family transporter n=1 Tax=Lactiplantibacillus plantarum TaxID=1590 RepID=UPI002657A2F4|nr:DMT family transporter [Lactiplantibacillus plantarum]MDN7032056.1 DMT family transporter [Lactiplantibacillus plantarum]
MQSLLFFLLAALAGLFQPIQSGINSQLKYDLNSTYLSGAISNFIGALLMVGLALTLERSGLQSPTLSGNHLWNWTGGILSALIVSAMIIVPKKISYSTFFALFIFGQLFMSLVIDYFGWFGSDHVPLSPSRIIGMLLLLAGVVLVKK